MDGMNGMDENEAVLATFSRGAGQAVWRGCRVVRPSGVEKVYMLARVVGVRFTG